MVASATGLAQPPTEAPAATTAAHANGAGTSAVTATAQPPSARQVSAAPTAQPAQATGAVTTPRPKPRPNGAAGTGKPASKTAQGARAAPAQKHSGIQSLSQHQLIGLAVAGGTVVLGLCALLVRALGRRQGGNGARAGGAARGAKGKGMANGEGAPGPFSHLRATSKCVPLADGSACVVRREIAADNSCLFNAVGYGMHKSRTRAPHLRNVVAQQVSSDPTTYSTAFLGMQNEAYCNWIRQPFNWGGGIELSILAQAYGQEIAAWNIESTKVHTFGEESGYKRQAMVIYNGVHYDALAIAKGPKADPDDDETDFNPRTKRGKMIIAAARKLTELTHKGSHFYGAGGKGKTAAAAAAGEAAQKKAAQKKGGGPKLKCSTCAAVLDGSAAAQQHAVSSGHTNFEEVAVQS